MIIGVSASRLQQSGCAIPKLTLSFTRIPEKAAFAAVLTDLDAELAALELRWTKIDALVRGMIHELLTGRIRLV